MNYPGGHGAAAGPWCLPDTGAGEAAATGDTSSSSFADMIAAGYSFDDLFEMAWGQGGGGGAISSPMSATTMQTVAAAESCRLWPPPEVRFDPPSEDEMAAWLCSIVNGGEELVAFNGGAGLDITPAAMGSSGASSTTMSDTKEEKVPMAEVMMMGTTKQEIRKPTAVGESSRRSHTGEAHNLTEKRRRHKINERLGTLQQLVPGCDKSNQASTLDQTIQYMRSLQHHLQEMSGAVPPQYAPPMAPFAVPAMMPPGAPVVLAPAPTTTATMVPFGAMAQLPHYPAAAVMMPAAAAAAPLYPAAAPPAAAAAAVAPGSAESSSGRGKHRHGSSRSKGKGGSSSLRLKR